MLNFSNKEYTQLKAEISEIRGYITRYTIVIITIVGLILSLIDLISKSKTPIKLLILFISTSIITLIFQIIWYKFKSHNRYTGYIQLLMQELNFIDEYDLKKDEILNKDYVRNYREYLNDVIPNSNRNLNEKSIESWEFIMSRLNSSSFNNKNDKKTKVSHVIKSTNKSKFVFLLPDDFNYEGINSVKWKNIDSLFFNKVIRVLYNNRDRKSKINKNYLKFYKKKSYPKLDKRYYVNGWGYPKLITNIVFSCICILCFIFLFILIKTYSSQSFKSPIDWVSDDFIIAVSIVGISSVLFYWIYYVYIYGIKEIMSGKYSIDGYCWTFFVFRIQILNYHKIIPVYFSRNFIRFFKSSLIEQFISNKILRGLEEIEDINDCSKCSYKNGECKIICIKYLNSVRNLEQFDSKDLRGIHRKINKAFKSQ